MVSQEIIQRCKRKEQQAFRLCYEACAPYVYTIIKSYLYDEAYRRDMMQEVFAQIFKSVSKYNSDKASFKTWITSITIHCCISHLRKKKKLSLITLEETSEVDVSYDEKIMDQMSRTEILQFLKHMPTGYRTVLLLNVIDGYSHKEIGQMLDTSAANSRSQLSRALNWARKNISKESLTYIYG